MASKVERWQSSLLHCDGSQAEPGPAALIFELSTEISSQILRLMANNLKGSDNKIYHLLREEFQKFYLWNDGFSTGSGELDRVLSCSDDLKGTVLSLMAEWVNSLLRVHMGLPNYEWSTLLPKLDKLGDLALKVTQVATSTQQDVDSMDVASNEVDLGNEFETASNPESTMANAGVEDTLEDLKWLMESLMDLVPSLEHPAMEIAPVEKAITSSIVDLSGILEAARPFAVHIREIFPSIDFSLLRKLSEANWKRKSQLKGRPTLRLQMEQQESGRKKYAASTVSPTNYSSTVGTSRTGESSLFDSGDAFPITESVTSLATSIGNGASINSVRRRVPNLPRSHDYDLPFSCQFCGDELKEVKIRAHWKKHVYKDLEPYICLFAECNLGLRTFHSRRDWINHEFQVHRVSTRWPCNLCDGEFHSQDSFRVHLTSTHNLGFKEDSVVEEFVHISKRLVSRNGCNEQCPFCLSIPAHSLKAFASHVGGHQREISLMALPKVKIDSDEESEADDSEDDFHSPPIETGSDDKSEAGNNKDEFTVAQQQRDYLPAIHNFLNWLHKNQSPATDERAAFIHIGAVSSYLKEDGRLEDILDLLFFPNEGPDVGMLLPNYVAIFSILMEIGRGNVIEDFIVQGLDDRHLPFISNRAPPVGFPQDTGDGKLYDRFCEKQWKYLAPNLEKRNTEINAPRKKTRASPSLPNLSLSAALQWRASIKERQNQKNKSRAKEIPILPGEWILNKCQKRDHVFVIDDTLSMKPHWNEVSTLFGILAYILKKSDSDGIDLYFTTSETKHTSEGTLNLSKIVNQRPEHLNDNSNMNARLENILEEYSRTLRNQISLRRSGTPFIHEIKPLTVYVFTDGVWTSNSDPQPAIRQIVNSLDQLNAAPGQVGIQFISFAEKQASLERLDLLDRDLNLKHDIVDTCSSTDNLWKMVLGAIDQDFDEGEKQDEEDDAGI